MVTLYAVIRFKAHVSSYSEWPLDLTNKQTILIVLTNSIFSFQQFCSWENPKFSSMVLGELLWQVAYSYTYELRPYLDLLLQMLLLEDSWQNHRILNALKGNTVQVQKPDYIIMLHAIECLLLILTKDAKLA